MPHLVSKHAYHYGIRDWPGFVAGLETLAQAVPLNDYCWCADNLITYGRAIGFLADPLFANAVNATNPSTKERTIMWRTHVVTWAARQCLSLPGDFVEAGVYKGHTARVVCNYLDFGHQDRTYWLYDLFAENPDQQRQLPGMGDELHREVVARFADLANVKIVRGALPASFADGMPEQVAFLHLDMNSADAEIGALDALWDRMPAGAIIILDDFGWEVYAAQRRRETEWFGARGKAVLELPTGQGMVIR